MNHLDPRLRHGPWTFAENAALKVSKETSKAVSPSSPLLE